MENILNLMDVLLERDNIVEKLDRLGSQSCPVLIYGNTRLTITQTISIFKTESRFTANVDINLDQQQIIDSEGAASYYTLHIYVYHKGTNKPIIRADIGFHRLVEYATLTNIELRVNHHTVNGYISNIDEDIAIHNIISLMFENAVDDIKCNDIDLYKYYLKNLKGSLEFALIDFIKGE